MKLESKIEVQNRKSAFVELKDYCINSNFQGISKKELVKNLRKFRTFADENDLTDMFESFTGFGLIIDNF